MEEGRLSLLLLLSGCRAILKNLSAAVEPGFNFLLWKNFETRLRISLPCLK